MIPTVVYVANTRPLSESRELFEEVYGSVSLYRREKTDRMRFLKDKCLSLGVECLLMRACRDLGIAYSDRSIRIGENGKPYFADSDICYNLSHSGERVMCIMSPYPVGCDVEQISSADLRIAGRFFTIEENATIMRENAENRNAMFTRLWTLKESFVKCTGMGFALSPSAFSLRLTGNGVSVLQNVDNGCYTFFEEDVLDGYKYAWCVKGTPENEQRIRWDSVSTTHETSKEK